MIMRWSWNLQRLIQPIAECAEPGTDSHIQIVQRKHGNSHFRVQLFSGFVKRIRGNNCSQKRENLTRFQLQGIRIFHVAVQNVVEGFKGCGRVKQRQKFGLEGLGCFLDGFFYSFDVCCKCRIVKRKVEIGKIPTWGCGHG